MSLAEAAPPLGYMERLHAVGMHPGWAKREPAMWPSPRRTYVPAVWRAADARAALMEACGFVSPEFAERRNLILANPIEANTYPSCATMVAAYQLVLAGETARSHRHTPNALRFVLDAEAGMVTLVNGIAVDMAPNDIVLTPQWCWHGHANTSDKPAFWIDVLDVPFVQKIENIFFQHHPDTLETATGADPDSRLRLKAGDTAAAACGTGPARVGGDQLPTMALDMQRLAPGASLSSPASIDNRLLIVAGGALQLQAEGLAPTRLERGDIAVMPSWTAHSLQTEESEALVFSVSDGPIFGRLGFRNPLDPA